MDDTCLRIYNTEITTTEAYKADQSIAIKIMSGSYLTQEAKTWRRMICYSLASWNWFLIGNLIEFDGLNSHANFNLPQAHQDLYTDYVNAKGWVGKSDSWNITLSSAYQQTQPHIDMQQTCFPQDGLHSSHSCSQAKSNTKRAKQATQSLSIWEQDNDR